MLDDIRPTGGNPSEDQSPAADEYTAFEKWPYKQIIYKTEHKQSWRNVADSFFRASLLLAKGVARRQLFEDIEGPAAMFLFRHYLELILKSIVLNGRFLDPPDANAHPEKIEKVKNIHDLGKLWEWVIRDAKPKMDQDHWNNYDTNFVATCIAEFDSVDKKGFAFRYSGARRRILRF